MRRIDWLPSRTEAQLRDTDDCGYYQSASWESRTPQPTACPVCLHPEPCTRHDDEYNRELVDAGITWPWGDR